MPFDFHGIPLSGVTQGLIYFSLACLVLLLARAMLPVPFGKIFWSAAILTSIFAISTLVTLATEVGWRSPHIWDLMVGFFIAITMFIFSFSQALGGNKRLHVEPVPLDH